MWLDEIEKDLQEEREFTEGQLRDSYDETSCERMARVLRELGDFIQFMGDLEWQMKAYKTTNGKELSDDAKELLG